MARKKKNQTKHLIMWLFIAFVFALAAFKIFSFEWRLLNIADDLIFAGALVVMALTLGIVVLLGAKIVKKIIKFLPLLMIVAFLFVQGCSRVGPGYVGIKVNMAGDQKGVDDFPAQTGWVTYNPFSTDVLKYPTFVQTASWTQDPNEGSPINEEITFTTADQMKVEADISFAYSLIPEKVPAFYVKFRSDDISKFTHGFLRNLAREKFSKCAGRYHIDEIMGNSEPFLADVRKELQTELDHIGVQLEQFGFIGAPRPPQAVLQAIDAKVKATQDAIRAENELRETEAQAQKKIAAAEGEAQSAIKRAQGAAEANRVLAASLSDRIIQWEKIQLQKEAINKWDGVRPKVEGEGAGLLLQIDTD